MTMRSTLLTTFVCIAVSGFARNDASQGANILEQTSKAFTQIAEQAMPATVFIKAESQAQQMQANPFDMFQDDFFQKFFGGNPFPQTQPQSQTQVALGSGFLISSDGYIVTNNHVVENATTLTVILNDGRNYKAILKGTDPKTDLALLKIEETNLPTLAFGNSDDLKVGEWVIAIGNPFGIGASLTVGVVSAKGERQGVGMTPYEDFIQTDAAINPGNSGGPLCDVEGNVIGVNTAIYTRSGGYMGIGFAIPSKIVQNVIDQIQTSGSVKRAYLGVVLQPVNKELADAMNLENQEGVLISEVAKNSPAAAAGLQQGDIILSYNGKPVKNITNLRNEIGLMTPGAPIKLQILRNNHKMTITATLGNVEGETLSAELMQKIGIEIEVLTVENATRLGLQPNTEGVLITKVQPGSSAANAGLKPGFVIVGVLNSLQDPMPIHSPKDFEEALKEFDGKKHIVLIIRSQNFQKYYPLKLEDTSKKK
jgi:serine protease Do